MLSGLVHVFVDEEGITIFERREEERVEVDVFQAESREIKLLNDRRKVNQDVSASSEIELVVRNHLFGGNGTAHISTPLEYGHPVAGPRQVGSADQAIMAGTDDNDVVVQSRIRRPRGSKDAGSVRVNRFRRARS
jgi:hypothetical protein